MKTKREHVWQKSIQAGRVMIFVIAELLILYLFAAGGILIW
jgi:hypothetical protein